MIKSVVLGLFVAGTTLLFLDNADARSPRCHRHLGKRAGAAYQPAYNHASYARVVPQAAYYRAPSYSAYARPAYQGYGYSGYSGLGYLGFGYSSGLGYSSAYRSPYSGYGGYGGMGAYNGYGGYGGYRNYGYGYPTGNYLGGYGRGLGGGYYGPSLGIPGTGLRIGF
jgi:hypothetical protein